LDGTTSGEHWRMGEAAAVLEVVQYDFLIEIADLQKRALDSEAHPEVTVAVLGSGKWQGKVFGVCTLFAPASL
jgi:hypothetical protein